MNVHPGFRAGKTRHLVAAAALVGLALGAMACSGGSGISGTGGSGGKATGGTGGKGTGGAAGSSVGGAAGTGVGGAAGTGVGGAAGAATDGGSDAPLTSDAPTDTPTLSCIVDGGDASGDCCPDDPDKTQPGVCGCGVSDLDTDSDGIPDCHDACPFDPEKTALGMCGCGIPETDTDNDGTPDCVDGCLKNPARTQPGLCGCVLPDTAAPACLAHRYSFNDAPSADGGVPDAGTADAAGGTTVVRDSVGTADGTAMNVVLRGTGSLTLAGGVSDQYVSLPSGIISALGNSATIEAWVAWDGGAVWQRFFDFGVANPLTPGVQGQGTSFVFVTPARDTGGTLLSVNTVGLTEVNGTAPFPTGLIMPQGVPHHVAAVVDANPAGDAGAPGAALYIDGVLIGRTALTSQLSGLQDINNWLGRSQFIGDPEFSGTYYEVRIHSAAMTQAQITASIAAGPDTLP